MHFYFAPLEGVTDTDWRFCHATFFPGIDKYFIPFISPTMDHILTPREQRMVSPDLCPGVKQIPQLLSKNSDDTLWAIQVLSAMGYQEINLNFGCPSGTVCAKGKGAGMLKDTTNLQRFLEAVFSKTPIVLSVKTRIGYNDVADWAQLLSVYRQYPISELIVHPRTKIELYRGDVHMECYRQLLSNAPWPVVANGNIFDMESIHFYKENYPKIETLMLGRGLVANPNLLTQNKDKSVLYSFITNLWERHAVRVGTKNALTYMKEIWSYLICLFDDSDAYDTKRLYKAIKKTESSNEYSEAVSAIFATVPILDKAHGII